MDFDPRDPDAAKALLFEAATILRDDPRRTGSVIDLPEHGRLVMTGDIHDHRPNFERCINFAKLDENPDNHLIVHELIHGKNLIHNLDLSIRLQLMACQQIIQHPRQVLSFLANHDLAQVRRTGILKAGGASVVEAFADGLDYLYGDDAERVNEAYIAFVMALPLAVRCGNGVMCAHSLPSPGKIAGFDPEVLERRLDDEDYDKDGHAHRMVWGRHQNETVTNTLAAAWGVETFLLGHQPCEFGWDTLTDRVLLLDSQHEHGVAVAMDLSKRYERDELVDDVTILSGVG